MLDSLGYDLRGESRAGVIHRIGSHRLKGSNPERQEELQIL